MQGLATSVPLKKFAFGLPRAGPNRQRVLFPRIKPPRDRPALSPPPICPQCVARPGPDRRRPCHERLRTMGKRSQQQTTRGKCQANTFRNYACSAIGRSAVARHCGVLRRDSWISADGASRGPYRQAVAGRHCVEGNMHQLMGVREAYMRHASDMRRGMHAMHCTGHEKRGRMAPIRGEAMRRRVRVKTTGTAYARLEQEARLRARRVYFPTLRGCCPGTLSLQHTAARTLKVSSGTRGRCTFGVPRTRPATPSGRRR